MQSDDNKKWHIKITTIITSTFKKADILWCWWHVVWSAVKTRASDRKHAHDRSSMLETSQLFLVLCANVWTKILISPYFMGIIFKKVSVLASYCDMSYDLSHLLQWALLLHSLFCGTSHGFYGIKYSRQIKYTSWLCYSTHNHVTIVMIFICKDYRS